MRIAISGAQNTGKSTVLKSFLYNWSNYSTPEKTYRDLISKDNHSSKTTVDIQSKVLDFMVEQMQPYTKDSMVIYDRCPLDNIAYSLWCFEKGIEGFTKSYIDKQIAIMKESMRFLDIIFLCGFDKNQTIVNDGVRDTNIEYIEEMDAIFEALFKQYTTNLHTDVFFPKDDSPCIIKLPHNPQSRINLISEYVTPEGSMYGDEDSIFNPEKLHELESLVKQQKAALDQEEKEKELFRKFGL